MRLLLYRKIFFYENSAQAIYSKQNMFINYGITKKSVIPYKPYIKYRNPGINESLGKLNTVKYSSKVLLYVKSDAFSALILCFIETKYCIK